MLRKLCRRLTYANVVSTLCLFLVVAGGTAYAANTVFSTDIVDGQVKTADLASPAVTNNKLAANAVTTGKVVDETLGAVDLAPGSVGTSEVTDESLGGADIAPNGILGEDIDESTLSVHRMGCQEGKVNGVARVKGNANMGAGWTASDDAVDLDDNCVGSSVLVRRTSAGVYYVNFSSNPSVLAVAISNSDNQSTSSSVRDNIVSVAKIPEGSCVTCGTFRVQVEDVSATGSGTVPVDGWFTIMVL